MSGAMKCAVAALAIGLACPAIGTAQSAQQLRSQAFVEAYNLDHAQANQTMERALRLVPQDAGLHRSRATIAWLEMLFARGTVTVDDYLGPVSGTDAAVEPPPAALAHTFKTSVERAIALADTTVAARPRDAEAWYQLGAALGLQASYVATVEGRVLGGLRAARRAYDAEERALNLSPARTDAGLIVGTYRYVVSGLSLPFRLMAYMAGFGGGKAEGLSYVEHAANTESDAQVDAQFALVLLYNREGRYGDALEVLRRLKQRFPRNRLLWLEEGATALRGANTEQADMILTTGLSTFSSEDRPRAPGELALWHYKRAVAQRRRDIARLRRGDQHRGHGCARRLGCGGTRRRLSRRRGWRGSAACSTLAPGIAQPRSRPSLCRAAGRRAAMPISVAGPMVSALRRGRPAFARGRDRRSSRRRSPRHDPRRA